MQNDRVVWYNPRPITTDACRLCGNTHHNHLILNVAHWATDLGIMDVAACGECKSAWFPNMERFLVPYPDTQIILQDPDFPYYIYHYLEIVGGLDWKVSLLERLPFTQFRSVLEIGCNAGVTLDYCRTLWNADKVIGLEPSAYGVMGSRLLEMPILPQYLHEATSIQDERFDFIYATEVLEHVPDPVGFLQEIKRTLTPNGILLLTTPRAGALNLQTPAGELLAALSPGAHYFLLSPEKLADLASQAGFAWCHIEPFGMTQVCILADHPVKLANHVWATPRIRDYYQRKTSQSVADARVLLGHWLNYHTYTCQMGLPVEATVIADIDTALQTLFGIDLAQPQGLLERVAATDSLVSLGKVMPYALPYYLYWRGGNYLPVAELLVLQGLKVDFQNLFVYDALLDKIREAQSTQTATSLYQRFQSQLKRFSNRLVRHNHD
jgi:SAM-dependent methyltransferase